LKRVDLTRFLSRSPTVPLSGGSTPTAYKFTGQGLDEATGLYFYNAWYYDPALGCFVQADTVVPEPGNPQALNRYAYALNNPLRYTDPTGHCPQCLFYALWESFFGNGVSGAGGDLYDPATGRPCGDTGCVTPHKSEAQVVAGVALDVAAAEVGGRVAGKVVEKGAGVVRAVVRGGGESGAAIRAAVGAQADFYVRPNGNVIPATGYRYISSEAPYLNELLETGTIPANPKGTYLSFDKMDQAEIAAGRLQVPHDAAIRIEFDTTQLLDDIRIPHGKWGTADYLEPLTGDFPQFGPGGATQAITRLPIWIRRIVDLRTGEVLYGTP
jgi:RHS repeat-associated protein